MSTTNSVEGGPVWVTGAAGLIGSWLIKTASPKWRAQPITRQDVDLEEFSAVEQLFRLQKPGAIIHCAALTRSPECQSHPALAHKLNVEVTQCLAQLAESIPFVFFSTDLVFDGRAGNYDEQAPVNPLSVYAETKVEAERLVLKNPRHSVIRTSLNGGPSPSGDRGFDEQMCRGWSQGQTMRLFTDEFRCPIAAQVTSIAAWQILGCNQPGLFHLAGPERISRWQIGQALARRYPELQPKLVAASIQDWQGAPRPPDTSLNCKKAQQLLTFELPKWTSWIEDPKLIPRETA